MDEDIQNTNTLKQNKSLTVFIQQTDMFGEYVLKKLKVCPSELQHFKKMSSNN